MNMLSKRGFTFLTTLSLLFLTIPQLKAAPMPEFGSSIQFDKTGPSITMAQLKGKAVLVLFFQSWCPICNGWAPKIIKQVEEEHGNNRALALLAIKTDGGGVPGAMQYLKSNGADLSKWCVGNDEGAAFHKQVTGKDELWTYALVGADGNIVEQGKAGSAWTSGPNSGKYTLASKDLLKNCGKVETLLPSEKVYPPDQSKIVRLAEMGNLGRALSLCISPAQKDIKQDILNVMDTRIKQRMDTLKDPSKDTGTRYEAYKDLGVMVKECPSAPAAKEAYTLIVAANSTPTIQKEKNAEIAYVTGMQKLQKASKVDRVKLLKELEYAGKRYEGTKYGELCKKESQATQ